MFSSTASYQLCNSPQNNRSQKHRRRSGSRRTKSAGKWVQDVKTVSTFPPKGLFTKDAKTIAHAMASKKVSPKGIGSGIRMIQYFINRGGKGLTARRKRELERAKEILQEQLHAKNHAARRRRTGLGN